MIFRSSGESGKLLLPTLSLAFLIESQASYQFHVAGEKSGLG